MTEYDLPALLIAPDRALAEEFLRTVPQVRAFQILGDLKTLPTEQALGMRLRQVEPEVVLVDVSGGLGPAGEVIRSVLRERPTVQVIGLGRSADPDLIVGSLRLGASEFLYAPFSIDAQQEAVSRLRRLRRPTRPAERSQGKVLAVASAKPGSGATTVAIELALALERAGGELVLLIDADPAGGTLAAAADPAGLSTEDGAIASVTEVLESGGTVNWHRRTLRSGVLDLLPAPAEPFAGAVNLLALQELLEQARAAFDWIILDLPVLFDRISLTALPPADIYLLLTTPELPALHLTKRALGLLETLGFGRQSVRVVVNRASRREGLGPADYQKIFAQPVAALLPPDSGSLGRRLAEGTMFRPLGAGSELGRAIERLAHQLRAELDKNKVIEAEAPVP